MLSRRTMRRPGTGSFQTAVWTVLPRHSISCGKPTLTEIKRGMTYPRSKFGQMKRDLGITRQRHIVGSHPLGAAPLIRTRSAVLLAHFGRSPPRDRKALAALLMQDNAPSLVHR